MNELDFKKLNFSVVGKNCDIQGDLRFTGDTLLTCTIKGTITVLDHSKLTLERDSHVEGDIYCHDIEVFGNFQGSIRASGKLTVRSSAVLSGNIEAQGISIYPGAILNVEGNTLDNNLDNETIN